MFEVSLFFFSIIPIMIFLVFGIPILVGFLVYRDANKRVDCNPWLWALIAALVPSFIGLIIYAIIRGDYPMKPEHQRYADSYGQTSYEQNFDENGNPIAKPHRGFPTWAKVLLIVGAILVVVGMFAGCGAMLFRVFQYDNMTMTPDSFYYEF